MFPARFSIMETANSNIVQLDSAIKRGSYGVSNVPLSAPMPVITSASRTAPASFNADNTAVAGKPLFVAKFNKGNVNYKDGLRRAVNAAKAKKANVVLRLLRLRRLAAALLPAVMHRIRQQPSFRKSLIWG